MFCGEVFETAKDYFFKFQTLLPVNIKQRKNNSLFDPIEQNA